MKGKIMLVSFISSFLSHCALGIPFQKSDQWTKLDIQPNTNVLVAFTEVKTGGSFWDRRIFWSRVSDVRNSLHTNTGYLGGSIRREFFGDYAWTVTVWKDEDSLEKFIFDREHTRAMKEGDAAVAKGKFLRMWKPAREVPIDWDIAIPLIREEGRDL